MPQVKPKLLILGGTKEAAALAQQAVNKFGDRLEVVTSLAGRTKFPTPLPGQVRRGGFGNGAQGLIHFIKEAGVTHLIDATHPFAAIISASAAKACDQTSTPRLTFCRAKWPQTDQDNWFRFKDFPGAAQALPNLAKRPFLTVGKQGAEHFYGCKECHFVLRLLEQPAQPLPFSNYEVVIGKPPFSLDQELALLKTHSIDALVTKESGGTSTEAKILAARKLEMPVLIIERPKIPEGETVEKVGACLEWLNRQI